MLYNDYRPKTLEEVVGHEEIKESLKSLFKENTFPHAFLFSGPSGTGKTTFARIIANMLGGNGDIIEVNIANTGGVDFVRELNELARRSPLLGNNKVFILDEVQQLTKEGQNAILKLLEDSPKHSYFRSELNELARRSPLLGNNKVFILDEVQQLTKEGQNAILKLLEDSPKHSYFILCTTDQ